MWPAGYRRRALAGGEASGHDLLAKMRMVDGGKGKWEGHPAEVESVWNPLSGEALCTAL